MSDEEPGRVRLAAIGGEVITTESDEEEMGMIIGAVLDGGRVLVNGGFRLRSNGKVMVWRCATCGEHGRSPARIGLNVIRGHRH